MSKPPTDHALDLGTAISSGLKHSVIRRMAEVYQKAGLWSPDMSVVADGAPATLAQHWLAHAFLSGDEATPSQNTFSWLLSLQPAEDLWSSRPRYGQTLGEIAVRRLTDDNQGHEGTQLLMSPQLWEALPLHAMKTMAWNSRHRNPSANIFSFALGKDRVDLVEILLQRGWNWDGEDGEVFSKGIQSAEMWELFLNSGGDPRQSVTYGDPSDHYYFKGPLWQFLAQVSPGHGDKFVALKAAASEFGKRVSPQLFDAKALESYWKKISQTHGVVSLYSSVVSRKDWPQLLNDAGENVLMVAMRNSIGVIKKFADTKKGLPLFEHVDKAGWSLWHHFANVQGASATPAMDDWKVVLQKAPIQPDPAHGLVTAVLLRDPNQLNQFAFKLPDNFWESPLAPKPEQVWGGTRENQEAAARVLLGDNCMMEYSLAEGLSKLLKNCPPPADCSPLLKGAVAAYALGRLSSFSCASFDEVKAQIDQGAVLVVTSDKTQKIINNRIAKSNNDRVKEAYQQLFSQGRSLLLGKTLPQASQPSAPKPRF